MMHPRPLKPFITTLCLYSWGPTGLLARVFTAPRPAVDVSTWYTTAMLRQVRVSVFPTLQPVLPAQTLHSYPLSSAETSPTLSVDCSHHKLPQILQHLL